MATSSFEKKFVVTDPNTIKHLNSELSRLETNKNIVGNSRDYEADKIKSIELFKRSLSR